MTSKLSGSIFYFSFISLFVVLAPFDSTGQNISISLNNTLGSKYIWHGVDQLDDSPVIQPTLATNIGKILWYEVWSSFALQNRTRSRNKDFDQVAIATGINGIRLILRNIYLDLSGRYVSFSNSRKNSIETMFELSYPFGYFNWRPIKLGAWYDLKLDNQYMVFLEFPFTFFLERRLFSITLRGEYTEKRKDILRPAESNVEIQFATLFRPAVLRYVSLQPILRINSIPNVWLLLHTSFSIQ